MRFDFIEIGTSDFDTLLETSNNKIGMSIEPLKFYLDSLPNNDKVIKVNCAISDTDFETDIFWISPDDIKKYDLPNWLRGCNSIINPHPSTIIELEKRNLLEIYKKSKCKCITWATLVSVYDITSVERLKIDTEGHDCKIVQSILSSNITLPNEILFENNVLTNEDDLNKTMSLLHEKGYYEVERSDYDILVKKLNKIGIDKVIFAVDDNPLYADFWPIQAKLVKEILKSEPVLFHITDNDSDFFDDGNGIVKRINKSNCPDIESSFQSQVIRMYGTKYFPEETCLTADIDMLMIDSDYFLEQIKEISGDDLVIYDSIAYDLERSECQNHNESCKDRYPICYILAKGKTLNKILNTNRSFEDYVDELQKLNLGWGTDELYFGDKVNNTNHGVNVVKLVRKYTTPWKAEKRIDRHNFPVILKHKGEIEAQKRDGIYDLDKLTFGHYIDVHCPRPYIEYKEEIDKLVEIIKTNKMENNIMFQLGIKHNTDKIICHRYDRIYPNFLSHLQSNTLKLFEIGYGGGESFKMWQEYFPNGSIFCMDIDKEVICDRGGVYKGDQSNIDDLQKMVNLIGECNIIVDDGSHVAQHQFDTFNFLFEKMLGNGGVYIIEDIECSYWHSDSEVYGYKTGELNIIDTLSHTPHKVNSEFSKVRNHQNISSITYSKNCIIIIKKTLEEINENNNIYRFEYKL